MTIFRRAVQRMPVEARTILVEARATAEKLDIIYQRQLEIDAERAKFHPLVTAPSSPETRRKPKAV